MFPELCLTFHVLNFLALRLRRNRTGDMTMSGHCGTVERAIEAAALGCAGRVHSA
jgi:hypothetical protein